MYKLPLLLGELPPYRSSGERIVVDVDVVALGMLSEVPGQRPADLLAPTGEAVPWWFELDDYVTQPLKSLACALKAATQLFRVRPPSTKSERLLFR